MHLVGASEAQNSVIDLASAARAGSCAKREHVRIRGRLRGVVNAALPICCGWRLAYIWRYGALPVSPCLYIGTAARQTGAVGASGGYRFHLQDRHVEDQCLSRERVIEIDDDEITLNGSDDAGQFTAGARK